jgi:hypothetical protein
MSGRCWYFSVHECIDKMLIAGSASRQSALAILMRYTITVQLCRVTKQRNNTGNGAARRTILHVIDDHRSTRDLCTTSKLHQKTSLENKIDDRPFSAACCCQPPRLEFPR